jgi:flagellin
MGLRINFNEASVNAYRNLASNQVSLSRSVERLSSGYRVNRGADDPAGLVRSEAMRAQIAGLAQALTNAQDAVNMVKTTEGALTEVHDLLRSMRALAIHAASTGTGTAQTAAADQAQIASALQSISAIASRTSFGGSKLLDGSAAIGFGTITGGGDGAATDISTVRAAATGSAFLDATGLKGVTVTVTQDATKAALTGSAAVAAGAQLGAGNGWTASVSSQITINGVNIGTFNATNTLDDVINAVNNNATLSQNVVAGRDAGNHLILTSKNYGSAQGITVQETLANAAGGVDAAGPVSYLTAGSTVLAADMEAGESASTTATAWGKDIQGTVSGAGVGNVTVEFASGKGFTMADAAGDQIVFSPAMVGTVAGSAAYTSTVSGSGTVFQIGADAGETATVTFNSVATAALGMGASLTFTSLSVIDVSTNAQEAIKVIDSAIEDVSTQRANMGAFQNNVLASTINSLSVTKENVAASESTIRDADMADEMASFTRFNILQQAGVAMLAQANQMPQQLLLLLRQ